MLTCGNHLDGRAGERGAGTTVSMTFLGTEPSTEPAALRVRAAMLSSTELTPEQLAFVDRLLEQIPENKPVHA